MAAKTQGPPATGTTPRPVFIYGTMCAKPLLAWVLTGDATQTDKVTPLVTSARVENAARRSLHGRDYPAAIRQAGSSIDGYLLRPQTRSQRKKLDDFEGEIYKAETVEITLLGADGETKGLVEADMYFWNGEKDLVSDESWDLEWFVKERLEDWIDLFEGMEMVGDDD